MKNGAVLYSTVLSNLFLIFLTCFDSLQNLLSGFRSKIRYGLADLDRLRAHRFTAFAADTCREFLFVGQKTHPHGYDESAADETLLVVQVQQGGNVKSHCSAQLLKRGTSL